MFDRRGLVGASRKAGRMESVFFLRQSAADFLALQDRIANPTILMVAATRQAQCRLHLR